MSKDAPPTKSDDRRVVTCVVIDEEERARLYETFLEALRHRPDLGVTPLDANEAREVIETLVEERTLTADCALANKLEAVVVALRESQMRVLAQTLRKALRAANITGLEEGARFLADRTELRVVDPWGSGTASGVTLH